MDIVRAIIAYVQANWVAIVAALWLIEQAMRAVSKLTPWKFDDNITNFLTNILTRFFPKRVP